MEHVSKNRQHVTLRKTIRVKVTGFESETLNPVKSL